jgi:IclR family transcriptional regulator, mhp operon transcriptional activator
LASYDTREECAHAKGVTMMGLAPTTSDTVKPIRALLRGLDVLSALNSRDGMVVSEVARATRLPRTTVYRVLETLVLGGFVVRDTEDDRYRPTVKLDALCVGKRDDGWIASHARPLIQSVGREILWPLMLHTPCPEGLRLRVSTDRQSPYALRQHQAGEVAGWLDTCPGIAAAAFLQAQDRQDAGDRFNAVLNRHGAAGAVESWPIWLEETTQAGHAQDLRAKDGEGTVSLALSDEAGGLLAVLSMRFIRSAISSERVLSELLARLRGLAEELVPVERPLMAKATRSARA